MKLVKIAMIGFVAFAMQSCGSKTTATDSETETNHNETVTAEAATYQLDASATKVGWKGTMMGMYSHTGFVSLTEGSLNTENGQITGGVFDVDVNSMSTTDSNYSEEGTPEMLVGHLKGADFFNTAEYPNATFTITNVDGSTISGDLSMRGTTLPQTIEDVVLSENDGKVSATGTLTFDRTAYGIVWKHKIKEMILSDNIELEISIEGNKI